MKLNYYTPFPRYENAIVVGDTAAEALAALHIYTRGLIGGDIPSMEVWHPTEKFLECTSCAMRDRPQILDAAARRIGVDYILLEDNGHKNLNPVDLKTDLEKEGFKVKVLNVQGEPIEIVERAAALYGEDAQRQAARIRRDFEVRLAQVESAPKPECVSVLTLLGIRHPVEDAVYCFAATVGAEITQDVIERLGGVNPVDVSDRLEDIKGLYRLNTKRLSDLLLVTAPSAIALCGDSAALQQRGVKLVSGGTDNHLMLIDLRDEECTGKDLEQRLDSVHITANKNTVPGETRSPFVTSGVRLGTPAVTTRGMGAAEMQVIADCIADCIWHYEEKKDEISERVLRLTREFPLYQ